MLNCLPIRILALVAMLTPLVCSAGEPPKVETGTINDQWRTGSWKTTTEHLRGYTRIENSSMVRYRDDPHGHWTSDRTVSYIEIGSSMTRKHALSSESYGKNQHMLIFDLEWTEADGSGTSEHCSDQLENGNHRVVHQVTHEDATGRSTSGSNISTINSDTTYTVFTLGQGWRKAERFDDPTLCKDPLFPFGFLKSKPPDVY